VTNTTISPARANPLARRGEGMGIGEVIAVRRENIPWLTSGKGLTDFIGPLGPLAGFVQQLYLVLWPLPMDPYGSLWIPMGQDVIGIAGGVQHP
jgi:hypothetical protein